MTGTDLVPVTSATSAIVQNSCFFHRTFLMLPVGRTDSLNVGNLVMFKVSSLDASISSGFRFTFWHEAWPWLLEKCLEMKSFQFSSLAVTSFSLDTAPVNSPNKGLSHLNTCSGSFSESMRSRRIIGLSAIPITGGDDSRQSWNPKRCLILQCCILFFAQFSRGRRALWYTCQIGGAPVHGILSLRSYFFQRYKMVPSWRRNPYQPRRWVAPRTIPLIQFPSGMQSSCP